MDTEKKASLKYGDPRESECGEKNDSKNQRSKMKNSLFPLGPLMGEGTTGPAL